MSNRPLIIVFAAAAGLACGWFGGRSGGEEGATKSVSTGPAGTRQGHGTTSSSDPPTRHDFASYVRDFQMPGEKEEAITAVERMSSSELRTLLLAAPPVEWAHHMNAEAYLQSVATNAAAVELLRREGIAAIDWSDGTNNKATRFALLVALNAADPRAGYERMKLYNMKYGGEFSWAFSSAAINAAALRGVDEVLEVQKLWDSSSLENIPAFAPDFDYGGYLAKADMSRASEAAPILTAWAAADPDATAKAMEAKLRARDWNWRELLGAALMGRATMAGEDEAARWICDLLPAVAPDQRNRAVKDLLRDISGPRAAALMKHLPTDEDRITLTGTLLQNYGYGNEYIAVAGLSAMDSEPLRVRAIAHSVKNFPPGLWKTPEARTANEAKLDAMMEKLGMSAAAKAVVRAAIPGP